MARQRAAARGTESLSAARGGHPEADLVFPGTEGATDPLSALWDAMPEWELQRAVVDGLRQRGYAVFVVPDMRKTRAGLPDIVALGPLNSQQPVRLLMWELKSQRGRVRPEQQNIIEYLQMVSVIDARIIRPSDWTAISEALESAAGPAERAETTAGDLK